jgi:hypothetical protein
VRCPRVAAVAAIQRSLSEIAIPSCLKRSLRRAHPSRSCRPSPPRARRSRKPRRWPRKPSTAFLSSPPCRSSRPATESRSRSWASTPKTPKATPPKSSPKLLSHIRATATPDKKLYLGARGFPDTAFFDRNGKLVYLKQGQYRDGEELEAEIKKFAVSPRVAMIFCPAASRSSTTSSSRPSQGAPVITLSRRRPRQAGAAAGRRSS